MTTTTEKSLDDKRLILADRIELRRFVGRELLLWIWLESEIFEGTLTTREHGSFGLWLEGRLVLDEAAESTIIKGTTPGLHRDAKEALLRGKTPERAGLHLSFGDHDCTLVLRGETLAFGALTPPRKEKEEAPAAALAPPPRRRKKQAQGDSADEVLQNAALEERMQFASAVEGIVTALYREFLSLRLSPTWDAAVVPTLERWVKGERIDVDAYRAARDRVLAKARPAKAS